MLPIENQRGFAKICERIDLNNDKFDDNVRNGLVRAQFSIFFSLLLSISLIISIFSEKIHAAAFCK